MVQRLSLIIKIHCALIIHVLQMLVDHHLNLHRDPQI